MKRFLPFQIYKYLAKDFVAWLVGMTFIILILIFLLEFSELLRRAQGINQATYSVMLEMTLLKLPHIAEDLLPFVLFFSAILCLWKLNRNHELVIIRSVGISAWQFLLPFSVISILIGCLDLCVINPISSMMKQRYDLLNTKYLYHKTYSMNVSETGVWIRQFDDKGSTIYRIGKVKMNEGEVINISLYSYDNNHQFIERTDATNGRINNQQLEMDNVWVEKVGQLPQFYTTRSVPTALSLHKLSETNISPDSMSFWELSHFIYLLEKSGLIRDEYKLYWHALIARVMWFASMIYLAGACVLHSVRQGKLSLYIFLGVIAGFGLYVLKDVTYVMGAASTIPVVLAAWTPVVITFMTGISVLLFYEDG